MKWLKKVADMNKMKKVANPDDVIDIEEMNPVWLKDKGKYVPKSIANSAYSSTLIFV